jgi:hypothetical protein
MQIIKSPVLTPIIIALLVSWQLIKVGPSGQDRNKTETKSPPDIIQTPGQNPGQNPEKSSGQSPEKSSGLPQLTGKLDQQHYFVSNSAIWQVSNGVFLGAMIETKRSVSDVVSPDSRITIKNLSSNTILYEKDVEGVPNSLYVRNVTPDLEPELIVDMGIPASSSNQFQIFTITSSRAYLILDENYVQDATLLDISDDAVDVLITTRTGHATRKARVDPLTTTLYRFQWDRYKSAGEIPFDRMKRLINKQLKPTTRCC